MAQFNRISLVSLLALGIAMPAVAQQAGAGPQTAPPAGEDQGANRTDRDVVIITANKREESVQDIAVAVTAITSELRDEIGLTTVQDYTNFAPGLTYSTASDRLGMRGVTRTSNNFGIRSGISNYVDGVYFSSAIPASREPIFVDRVEVVRGPQGTLYGRDSIGGALNVITKRPTEEFEGQVNLNAGNFGQIGVATTMAGPINDWSRYRVGYSRQAQNEGTFTNYATGDTEGNRRDDAYIEGQLEFDVGENLDLWVRAGSLNWNNRIGAPGARTGVDSPYPYNSRFYNSTADIGPNGWSAFNPGNTGVVAVGSQTTNPSITDRLGFNTDFQNFAHLSPTSELALEAVYHAPGFDVKYLGGYVYYNYNLQQDQDGTSVKSFVCGTTSCGGVAANNGRRMYTERVSDYTENRGWFSNELNFISTWDGPLQITSGIYAYQENYNQLVYVSQVQNPGGPIWDAVQTQDWLTTAGPFTGAPAPTGLIELPSGFGRNSASGSPIPGASLMLFTNNQGLNNAYGAFIQGDYQVNDQLKLTAGVRYSTDILSGREYARFVSHSVVENALESGFIAAYSFLPAYAGLRGALGPGALPIINAVVPGAVPNRIDATSTLGGADPSTITGPTDCGHAGAGVINLNETTGNATPITAPDGSLQCRDKTRYGIYRDAATGNSYRDLHAEFEEVTGVLGIDWTPDDDTLIYGKYSRGYKPGGLGCADVFCVFVNTPFTDKELVDAFELGYKKQWSDWNLTTNATLFYYDYQGYQVSNTIVPDDPGGGGVRPPPYSAYVNLPQTKTTGFELETIWYPTDDLRFILNYGYTNPEIGDTPSLVHALDPLALDPSAQPQGAVALCKLAAGQSPTAPSNLDPLTRVCDSNGVSSQGQNLKGNILPFSPKNKIALNGTYTWHMEDGAKIDASLSYFWQDVAYSSIFNRSYTEIPAWDQTDGRLTWTSTDGNISLIGFVRNLFDQVVYDSRGAGGIREGTNRAVSPRECFSTPQTTAAAGAKPGESCYTIGETLRPPRTYGVELQVRF